MEGKKGLKTERLWQFGNKQTRQNDDAQRRNFKNNKNIFGIQFTALPRLPQAVTPWRKHWCNSSSLHLNTVRHWISFVLPSHCITQDSETVQQALKDHTVAVVLSIHTYSSLHYCQSTCRDCKQTSKWYSSNLAMHHKGRARSESIQALL